ncbi:MAG: hypothetical protein JW943_04650 [Deltaproteobacteria bacterium]|nr:hypothetical protein [Deltaproteobacteria bacterium]
MKTVAPINRKAIVADLILNDSQKDLLMIDHPAIVKEFLDTRSPVRGDCPFCDDAKNSLSYYPLSDSFFCRRCRKSGELLDLYKRIKGIDSDEAAESSFVERYIKNQDNHFRDGRVI